MDFAELVTGLALDEIDPDTPDTPTEDEIYSAAQALPEDCDPYQSAFAAIAIAKIRARKPWKADLNCVEDPDILEAVNRERDLQ